MLILINNIQVPASVDIIYMAISDAQGNLEPAGPCAAASGQLFRKYPGCSHVTKHSLKR